jgi:hypothetical protein
MFMLFGVELRVLGMVSLKPLGDSRLEERAGEAGRETLPWMCGATCPRARRRCRVHARHMCWREARPRLDG